MTTFFQWLFVFSAAVYLLAVADDPKALFDRARGLLIGGALVWWMFLGAQTGSSPPA